MYATSNQVSLQKGLLGHYFPGYKEREHTQKIGLFQ